MSEKLKGCVAIVTGAAKGQGAAEAQLFVQEGATVVMGDVLESELDGAAEAIGARAHPVLLDVTRPDHWASTVKLASDLGPLKVLVNNAGIHWTRPIEHESLDDLRRILDVNLVGAFAGMQAVVEPMTASGGGSIVNVSSLAGMTGLPYHAAYGASKWALRGLTKTAAVEWGHRGIRVNSIHPGAVLTDMLPPSRRQDAEASTPSQPDARFGKLPLGRAASAEEVARLVLFLACDDSSYQTGSEVVVDGGSLAGPTPSYRWEP